jgi:hypothetical protein
MEETPKVQDAHNTILIADDDAAVKRHIARLAWLLGTGQGVSATVPADEIKQAESYLFRIGIAAPVTPRTPNLSLSFAVGGDERKRARTVHGGKMSAEEA